MVILKNKVTSDSLTAVRNLFLNRNEITHLTQLLTCFFFLNIIYFCMMPQLRQVQGFHLFCEACFLFICSDSAHFVTDQYEFM